MKPPRRKRTAVGAAGVGGEKACAICSASAESREAGGVGLYGTAAFRICAGRGRLRPRKRHRPSSSPMRRRRRTRRKPPPSRCAGSRSVDPLAALQMCGRSCCWAAAMDRARGSRDDGQGDAAAQAWSAAIGERSFMKGTSGERERATPASASPRTALPASNPSRRPSPSQRRGRGRHKKRRPTGWWGA